MRFKHQPKEVQDFLEKEASTLTKLSKEICQDNQCTEDKHNCESNAYYTIIYKSKKVRQLLT